MGRESNLNRLEQQFDVEAPNRIWNITYIRPHEGWLYLAVVLDLFSRQVVGWSMQSRMERDLVLNALLMAVWRRQRWPHAVGQDFGFLK